MRSIDDRNICYKFNFDAAGCDGTCGMAHVCCWSTCLKINCKIKDCAKAKAEGFVLRPRRS